MATRTLALATAAATRLVSLDVIRAAAWALPGSCVIIRV